MFPRRNNKEYLIVSAIGITKQQMFQISRQGRLHEKHETKEEEESHLKKRESYKQKCTGDVYRGHRIKD